MKHSHKSPNLLVETHIRAHCEERDRLSPRKRHTTGPARMSDSSCRSGHEYYRRSRHERRPWEESPDIKQATKSLREATLLMDRSLHKDGHSSRGGNPCPRRSRSRRTRRRRESPRTYKRARHHPQDGQHAVTDRRGGFEHARNKKRQQDAVGSRPRSQPAVPREREHTSISIR